MCMVVANVFVGGRRGMLCSSCPLLTVFIYPSSGALAVAVASQSSTQSLCEQPRQVPSRRLMSLAAAAAGYP